MGFENGKVKSKMVSSDHGAILMLEKENDIIPKADDLDFYFSEPSINLKPYLDLIDDEEAEVQVDTNKMKLYNDVQEINVFFTVANSVNIFGADKPELRPLGHRDRHAQTSP